MRRTAPALAKLTAPRFHRAVPRTRLFDTLDRHPCASVCWIAGPPGSGKTTLAATYLQARRTPCTWYQVDAGDADPASFFHHLTLAVEHTAQEALALPVLLPEYLGDLPGFARRYFRAMFAHLPARHVLVMDNCQEAPAEAAFHQISAIAAQEKPAAMRLIAISRTAPPRSWVRLLASDVVGVLDWEDLRLTTDETHRLAAARQVDDPQVIDRLQTLSDGWAGGVTLMLERVRRAGPRALTSAAESRDHVFDYFAAQVFDAASPAIQRFLLRTAYLPRMSIAMAEQVAQAKDAIDVLQDLHRRRLFVDRRALGQDLIYEYHALFREFLCAQAQARLGDAEVTRLRTMSASVMEAHGLVEEAVAAYRNTSAWPELARLALEHARDLLAQGRVQTLREWLSDLPQAMLHRDPWLAYWLGVSFIAVDQERACAALERAYAVFAADGDVLAQIRATSGIIEARFLEIANFPLVDEWLPIHERLLQRLTPSASAEVRLQAHSAMLILTLYRRPEHPLLTASVKAVLELLDSDASADQRLGAATFVMVYCTYTGDTEVASLVVPRGESLFRQARASALRSGSWLNWLGYWLTLQAQPEQALRVLESARDIGEQNGLGQVVFLSHYFAGSACRLVNDTAGIVRHLRALESLTNPGSPIQLAIRSSFAAWAGVWTGKPAIAVERGRDAWQRGEALGSPSYLIHWGTPWIYGLVAQGEFESAADLVARQRAAVQGTNIRCFEPLFLAIEATIALAQGQERSALSLARQMVQAVTRPGYAGFLDWVRPWMPALCTKLLGEGHETQLVQEWIRMFRWPADSLMDAVWPWKWRILTLGGLVIEQDDEAIEFGRKLPRKPLALLRALIAAGGRAAEHDLVDQLWPNEEGDAGHKSFSVALYRLRQLLGDADLLPLRQGMLALDTQRVWVDALALKQAVGTADTAWRAGRLAEFAALMERAERWYQGPFLPDELDQARVLSFRERLREGMLTGLARLAELHERNGEWPRALAAHRRGIAIDEVGESFYQGLMRCHLALAQPADGLKVYRLLRAALSRALGTVPSPASEALRARLAGTQVR
jgi:DNA-binding SARP family transcriptional activator